jgi:hypothetical protein
MTDPTTVDTLVQTEAEAIAAALPHKAPAAVSQPEVLPTSETVVAAPTPVIISRPSTSPPPQQKAAQMPKISGHPLREWQKRKLEKQRHGRG